jgi:N-acetylglutamate synthase-like GNAT family acetyltransferase
MNDRVVEYRNAQDTVTTNRDLIPVDAAFGLLKTTHWAADLSLEILERAMENSLCFGVLRSRALVGFARVITDRATYAYLTDVVIAAELRGQGVGRWMIERILDHPDLQNLRRVTLLTRDGAEFYSGLGFTTGAGALTYMERRGAFRAGSDADANL